MFIGAVLGVLACAGRIRVPSVVERHALAMTTYAIGITAAFWFIERLAAFPI